MDYWLIVQLGLLIFFTFLLVKATEITIKALNRLSRRLKIGAFALTAFLLALATSLPELFVSMAAAFEGKSNLALGIVIGSNIANLSLVIGGTALVGGTIPIVGDFLKKDLFHTFLSGAIPLILLLDKRLSVLDGLILILVYAAYNYTVLRQRPNVAELQKRDGGLARRIFHNLGELQTEKQLAWLFISLALMIFSADMVVKTASGVAESISLPPLLIGLILVAVGTSLPELTFGIQAVRQRKIAMVFGNLLGSVVANSTLILGLTAIISPIQLDGGLHTYLTATLAFLVIFNLFWLFVRTKRKLERWEGAVLFLAYIVFIIFEFWQFQKGMF